MMESENIFERCHCRATKVLRRTVSDTPAKGEDIHTHSHRHIKTIRKSKKKVNTKSENKNNKKSRTKKTKNQKVNTSKSKATAEQSPSKNHCRATVALEAQ